MYTYSYRLNRVCTLVNISPAVGFNHLEKSHQIIRLKVHPINLLLADSIIHNPPGRILLSNENP